MGLVAQENGSLGVFRLGAGGPEVVHAAFREGFHAAAVLVHQAGDRAYVLDAQWREHGGGIHSRPGHTGHVVALGQPPRLWGGLNVFGDDKGSISAVAKTPGGGLVLMADNDEFSGVPNRVAVLSVSDTGLDRQRDPIEFRDPVSVAVSPYGNAALVVSGYGNAIFALRYDPAAPVGSAPAKLFGEPAYRGARPQLPGSAAVIGCGALKGKVLVAENLGVRQFRLQPDGVLLDEGLVPAGTGLESIVGAIGVQP